jgi:hypothetical protein
MNRREALSAVSVLLGGSIIGAEFFLAGCKANTPKEGKSLLSTEDIALLEEIGEVIIPATADSGGAKAAKTGTFIKTIVTDCYTDAQQKAFTEGITAFKEACRAKYKKDFTQLSATERTEWLTALAKQAKDFEHADDYQKKKAAFEQQQDEWVKAEAAKGNYAAAYLKEKYPPHYFTMLKQLTIWGYFSSEVGMTRALRYVEVPGKYDGAYPYKKGDKAWAV